MLIKEVKLHINDPPWITVELKKLIKRRQLAFHDNHVNLCRIYRNRVNRERKRWLSKFFSMKVKHLKETKPSLWWKEVKRISGMIPGSRTEGLQMQLKLGHSDEPSVGIADRINETFLDSMRNYQTLEVNAVQNVQDDPFHDSLIEITEIVVYQILSKINQLKVSGPDGLSNWLLKEYAEVLAQPICSILNNSFLEMKLPSVWIYAAVIPIPKQKPIIDINKHLQPISLTSTISKFAEEFVVSKYIAPAVLEVIDSNQFGAIPKSSTTQALISMIHQWAKATGGTGAAVRIILFDYKKAFDLTNHHILLEKLRNLSIPYNIFCWIIDSLTDKFQRVKLSNDWYSEWGRVPSGVPQGTKLGPWLFLFMIKDLKVTDIPIWKFVDDTTISEVVPKGSPRQVRQGVKMVENWSVQNKFQLDPDKCKELITDFKRRKQHFEPIIVNDNPVEVVHQAKILGLAISDTLSRNNHVNKITKKTNKRLYFLVQLKRANVPTTDVINFYFTCIRPILEYGAQVFHYALPGYLRETLERVQKQALSILFLGVSYYHSLELSGLISLSARRQVLCNKLFSVISEGTNHELHDLISPSK